MDEAPRVGVSACLLGERVRYDGSHRWEPGLRDALEGQVCLVAVCPEVELGLGTPREPVELVRLGDDVRLLGRDSRDDHSDAMRQFARARILELRTLGLAGYIFKSRSPSCGLDVPILDAAGAAAGRGEGLFAAALRARWPDLPVAEECGLRDRRARENFLGRVHALWERHLS